MTTEPIYSSFNNYNHRGRNKKKEDILKRNTYSLTDFQTDETLDFKELEIPQESCAHRSENWK